MTTTCHLVGKVQQEDGSMNGKRLCDDETVPGWYAGIESIERSQPERYGLRWYNQGGQFMEIVDGYEEYQMLNNHSGRQERIAKKVL